jgi:energy-coupling factor transporter transmembrane protein EcfT
LADVQPAFDLYVGRETWLQALDPRVKLFFVGLIMVTAGSVVRSAAKG